jgi:hypothetical protein
MTATIEKALFIESPDELSITAVISDVDRIYFGEEYCGRRTPAIATVNTIIDKCVEMNKAVTFLTPPLTEPEFKCFQDTISQLLNASSLHSGLQLEIVINDLGVWRYLKSFHNFIPVLGTLLIKQKRDPGFLLLSRTNSREIFTEKEHDHIQSLNIDSNQYISQFVESNFKRIELSNSIQGWNIDCNLPASLYFPLVPFTTTRYCKWAAMEAKAKNASNYFNCSQSCKNAISKLAVGDYELYLYGNTQFYYNSEIPYPLEKIDRLVFYTFSAFNNCL